MPRCLFKALTGWSCPGCGSQRALMHLLRGHLADALAVNLLLPFGIVYLLLLLSAYLFPANNTLSRLNTRITSPAALAVILIIIVGWTIARNLLHI